MFHGKRRQGSIRDPRPAHVCFDHLYLENSPEPFTCIEYHDVSALQTPYVLPTTGRTDCLRRSFKRKERQREGRNHDMDTA